MNRRPPRSPLFPYPPLFQSTYGTSVTLNGTVTGPNTNVGIFGATAGTFQDALVAIPGASGLAVAKDRKSTRLNSSHLVISYAVFCLKKKKRTRTDRRAAR